MRLLNSIISTVTLLALFIVPLAMAEVKSFSQIKKDKVLRVLTWQGNDSYLPRAGSSPNLEFDLISRFAEQENLTIKKVPIMNFAELIPALQAGKGDVIASNLTINRIRSKLVNFSIPVTQTVEFLVSGIDQQTLNSADDLNQRSIAVQMGTSYALTAIGLANVYPKLTIVQIPPELSHEEIFDRVASGEYDLTIIDNNVLKSTLMYRADIKRSLQANSAKDIGWAVHNQNSQLRNALDSYLSIGKAVVKAIPQKKTDWDIIKERRTIRFVMRNNISSYYLWKGELMGFHYELAKDFAKYHKLRYEILVAPDNKAMFDYLKQGKADIALGFFTPSQNRINQGLVFSKAYHYATEQLVLGTDDLDIVSIDDLKGRNIAIRKSSSYWQTFKHLKTLVPSLDFTFVPETYDTERVIAGVGEGKFDITIADNHIVDLELNFRDDIKSSLSIGKEKSQSWAIKSGQNALLSNVNNYIKRTYKGLFYNVIHKRYFSNQKLIDLHYQEYYDTRNNGALSPYDDVVKKYADQYGFDPKLLIAQMHQESRFNPKAKSGAGAKGLFQVMPRTAKQMEISNVEKPENGIHAGVKYLSWVQQRAKVWKVQEDQLIWFTLASYNAGHGHVSDAIRLAKEKGWEHDIWFGNVEKAILLLSQRKYSSKARYGYVRGAEPVNYVRNIRHKYQVYLNQVGAQSAYYPIPLLDSYVSVNQPKY